MIFYESFEVFPNVEKLRIFREEFLKNFKGDLINKIISRSDKWYKYDKGIYTPSTIGLSIKPLVVKNSEKEVISSHSTDIRDFINYGIQDKKKVSALRLKSNSDVKFLNPINKFFFLLEDPQKLGRTYSTTALEINEDLYNMAMIQCRNFLATTTPDDLSRYSEFFEVSDEAYAGIKINEQAISDFNRCGIISEGELRNILDTLEATQRSVLSLKR